MLAKLNMPQFFHVACEVKIKQKWQTKKEIIKENQLIHLQ
jgi:hypothetical protein